MEEAALISVSGVKLKDHMLRSVVSDSPAIKAKPEIPI